MRTLIVVVGIFYTVLLSGSTVDALQLSEYSEVFSQYSDSLGNDGVYRILLDALNWVFVYRKESKQLFTEKNMDMAYKNINISPNFLLDSESRNLT